MHHPTIALITGKHPIKAKSGYASYGRALARQLTAIGCDVHIFCAGNRSSVTPADIGTIHVVKIPLLGLVSGREMSLLLPASVYLARGIRKQPADIIWGIGPWTLAGVLAGGRPIFADYFTTLRHEYHTALFSFVERYILTKSTRIITHYRSTENIITKEFGVNRKTLYRIPYAI